MYDTFTESDSEIEFDPFEHNRIGSKELWSREPYVHDGHTIIDRYITTDKAIERAKKDRRLRKYKTIGWVLPSPIWDNSFVPATGFSYIMMDDPTPNFWHKIIEFNGRPEAELIIQEIL